MPTKNTQEITVDVSRCGDKKKAANFFHETTNGLFVDSKRIKINPDGTITGTIDPRKFPV